MLSSSGQIKSKDSVSDSESKSQWPRCATFANEWVHPMLLNMYKDYLDSIGTKIRRTVYFLYYKELYRDFDSFMDKMDQKAKMYDKKPEAKNDIQDDKK